MTEEKHISKINIFDDFHCIAGDCPMTCCQEWKIAVDAATEKKWQKAGIQAPFSKTDCAGEDKIICLNTEKKCPFLRDDKLCTLVADYDDTYLSYTCTSFPREDIQRKNVEELFLTACCPEVVRLFSQAEHIYLMDAKSTEGFDAAKERNMEDRLLEQIRSLSANIMADENNTIRESLLLIFYILLELREEEELKEEQLKYFSKQSTQKELLEVIRKMQFNSLYTLDERNELFLDLAENYRKQGLYSRLLEPLAKTAERISDSYQEADMKILLKEFEQKLRAYDRLFRNYLVSEILSSFLKEDADLPSMMIAMEWIGLEYAAMVQALFLHFLEQQGTNQEKDSLPYEVVRDNMVLISRMTGYDEEDIWEYLEDSFENVIWDWGYFALIVGKDKK